MKEGSAEGGGGGSEVVLFIQHDITDAFFTLVLTSVKIGELVRTNVASTSHIVPLSGLDNEFRRELFEDENIFVCLRCCELFLRCCELL